MRSLLTSFVRLLRDRKAATAVEYAFVLVSIAVAILATLMTLASTTTSMWNNVSYKVQNAR